MRNFVTWGIIRYFNYIFFRHFLFCSDRLGAVLKDYDANQCTTTFYLIIIK